MKPPFQTAACPPQRCGSLFDFFFVFGDPCRSTTRNCSISAAIFSAAADTIVTPLSYFSRVAPESDSCGHCGSPIYLAYTMSSPRPPPNDLLTIASPPRQPSSRTCRLPSSGHSGALAVFVRRRLRVRPRLREGRYSCVRS